MEVRDKVKKIFNYLLSVKSINEKVIDNISYYNKVYLESKLKDTTGCVISNNFNDDWWMKVDKRAKELYDYLFDLYQKVDNDDKNIELIYGNCVLSYTENSKKINHPLVTTNLKIFFNTQDSKIYLKQMGNINIEFNCLDNTKIKNYDEILNIREEIKEFNIKEQKNLQKYYEAIGNILTKYMDNIKLLQNGMIIERKKNTNIWKTELKDTIAQLEKGLRIPKTVQALVSEDIINRDKYGGKEELLFPFAANEEQKEIGRRISQNYGVVVQGPPGTGKSHTIANLICHLLANGKRVLVTSETERALKVLKNKIPEEIKCLCMSNIGNSSSEFKELEQNVRKITDNLSYNLEELEIEITLLNKQLLDCKYYEKSLMEKIKKINEVENQSIKYGNKNYKVIDIAKWLKDNERDYSWIEDKITQKDKVPISEEEFNKLINYMKSVTNQDKRKIQSIKVVIDRIPSYDEIANSIKCVSELQGKYKGSLEKLNNWKIYDSTRFKYKRLISTLAYAKNNIKEMKSMGFDKIMEDYYSSDIIRQSISSLLFKWNGYIKRLYDINKKLNDHKLDIPENVSLDKFEIDFNSVYEEINKNGKIRKLFTILHKEYDYIFKECLVDYKPLTTIPQAITLKLYLEANSIERNMVDLWNNTMKNYKNVVVNKEYSNALFVIEKYMNHLFNISKWNEEVKLEIIKCLGNIQCPLDIDWHKEESFDYIKECAEAIKIVYEYKDKKAYLQSINKLLYPIKEFRGACIAIEELNLVKLRENFIEIYRLKDMKKDLDDICLILFKLKQVCPNLSQKIAKGDVKGLNDWNIAWKWRQWDCIIKQLENINESELENRLENEKEKEKEIIKQIIYKKTWYNQISKTTESQKRSLFSWIQAVKRIGKGTGKFVPEYLKVAQKELQKCKNFIPAWIMPIGKVIENIRVTSSKFDVVIIDESSQSNIFAISALMRAKKAIIVGDDKQISPEAIGVDQDAVKRLINMYLKDVPNREWFDLQTSLYDTALRVFPNRLMLKEHFRCAPEIIEFSNKTCYSDEIVALRHPYKFERFDSSIVPVKIQDGKREIGKCINKKEAQSIADTIEKCCKNKKYNNMTMGVISLLGDAQADYIHELLKKKIGEKEIVKRKLVCGDAYSFQGDERDIMFLSMVISDNVKFTALTRDSDIRRFNVAASRAKNQMWLFYSVDIQKLSKECIRYKLLNYCLNFRDYNKSYGNVEYVFYSNLQKDVYKVLKENGFNPLPNIKIGNYKIDFILEGLKNRAAVICEHEREDEILSWDERYNAQLKLKQCGWNIIKIRPIDFYRNLEATMNKVFFKLRCSGINVSFNSVKVKSKNKDSKKLKVV